MGCIRGRIRGGVLHGSYQRGCVIWVVLEGLYYRYRNGGVVLEGPISGVIVKRFSTPYMFVFCLS